MANSRIARFVMEVAPPQFVSVMRHRTAKIMDTISEEEKDSISGSDSLASASFSTPKSFSSSCSTPSSSLASASASASAFAAAARDSKYFLRGVQVQQSFSIFEN